MSKTKITPLGFGAVLYEIEEDAIIFDENGRIIQPKKTKSARPQARKSSAKPPHKPRRKA